MSLDDSGRRAEEYPMLANGAAEEGDNDHREPPEDTLLPHGGSSRRRFWLQSFTGVLLLNFVAFLLPHLREVFEQPWAFQDVMRYSGEGEGFSSWTEGFADAKDAVYRRQEDGGSGEMKVGFGVADVNSTTIFRPPSMWATVMIASNVLDEGLPRAAWLVIGDRSSRGFAERLGLTYSLVSVQAVLGLVVSVGLYFTGFNYDWYAFTTLFRTIDVAIANAARALDRPDVPLVMSAVAFTGNVLFDYLLRHRANNADYVPWEIAQGISFGVSALSTVVGLAYLLWTFRSGNGAIIQRESRPSFKALKVLALSGLPFVIDSLTRNLFQQAGFYSSIITGARYYGWGIFETFRRGVEDAVPDALQYTSLAFIGHAWGEWRKRSQADKVQPRARRADLQVIAQPALTSTKYAFAFEIVNGLAIFAISAKPYLDWRSASHAMSSVTGYMRESIGWVYIFYAFSTQLATILLATRPSWYLYQSLIVTVLYTFPLVLIQKYSLSASQGFYNSVEAGQLVLGFLLVVAFDVLWAWSLSRGKMRLGAIQSAALR